MLLKLHLRNSTAVCLSRNDVLVSLDNPTCCQQFHRDLLFISKVVPVETSEVCVLTKVMGNEVNICYLIKQLCIYSLQLCALNQSSK